MTLRFALAILIHTILVQGSFGDITTSCNETWIYNPNHGTYEMKYVIANRALVYGFQVRLYFKSDASAFLPAPVLENSNDLVKMTPNILQKRGIKIILKCPKRADMERPIKVEFNDEIDLCKDYPTNQDTHEVTLQYDTKAKKAEIFKQHHDVKININCARPLITTRSIGGDNDIEWRHYPWAARVRVKGDTMCTANLISKNVAVTAKHCFEENTKYSDIKLELYNNENEASVWGFVNHSNNDIDISLLFLTEDIQSVGFSPVCLSEEDLAIKNGESESIAGTLNSFGIDEMGDDEASLTQLKLNLISQDACTRIDKDFAFSMDEQKFCASTGETNVGPCRGDSGGGFVTDFDDKRFLIGILRDYVVDKVTRDCDTNKPSIFTYIHPFTNTWIANDVDKIKSEDPMTTSEINAVILNLENPNSIESILAISCPNNKSKYNRNLGCYQDTNKLKRRGNSTSPGKCVHKCFEGRYKYAGVKNSNNNCYCGNEKEHKSVNEHECDGGDLTIKLYETGIDSDCPNGKNSMDIGCYKNEAENTTQLLPFDGSDERTTREECITLCQLKGFIYAGTMEFCFCGNQKPPVDLKMIRIKCNKKLEINIYETGIKIIATKNGTNIFETIKRQQFCPHKNSKYGRSIGCYNNTNDKLLKDYHLILMHTNTPERCIQKCYQMSMKYAGVQDSVNCYCGNERPLESLKTTKFDCNKRCSGNRNIPCGSHKKIDVYETGIINECPAGKTKKVYEQFLGCYKEDYSDRLLPFVVGTAHTSHKCIELCFLGGFIYAGKKEIDDHCYCGNHTPPKDLNIQRENCFSDLTISIYETGIKSFYYGPAK